MPQPQHFSDYGFDPQIDYFQVPILSHFPFSFTLHQISIWSSFLFLHPLGSGRSEEAQAWWNQIHRLDSLQAPEAHFQGRLLLQEASQEEALVEKRYAFLQMELDPSPRRPSPPPLPPRWPRGRASGQGQSFQGFDFWASLYHREQERVEHAVPDGKPAVVGTPGRDFVSGE